MVRVTFRKMTFSRSAVRTLEHAALIPEVSKTLVEWVHQQARGTVPGVLIGGLALSFYTKPRETTDVDLLFMSDIDVPHDVKGFRRHRKGAFEEKETQVEVEVCTPASISIPVELARKVHETAHVFDGLRVASLEALIALKLYGSRNRKRELQDLADVQRLLEANPKADLSGWPLTDELFRVLNEVRQRV